MQIEEYVKYECDRQHTRKIKEMTEAFTYASNIDEIVSSGAFACFVMHIAKLVEPTVNINWTHPAPLFGMNMGGTQVNFRRSHVGFFNGGTACPASEVPDRFDRLIEFTTEPMNSAEIDLWIKSLLDVHPWADGNGRTASIIRNWMMGQMDDPQILPYYYGE